MEIYLNRFSPLDKVIASAAGIELSYIQRQFLKLTVNNRDPKTIAAIKKLEFLREGRGDSTKFYIQKSPTERVLLNLTPGQMEILDPDSMSDDYGGMI